MKTCFEWDSAKAETNLQKHGVSFETATRVFSDPYAFFDQNRVESGESGWQAIGVVDGSLLLMVAHVVHEHDENEVIRIISPRRADSKERKRYEENHGIRD